MVTGDHPGTAKNVGQKVKLFDKEEEKCADGSFR